MKFKKGSIVKCISNTPTTKKDACDLGVQELKLGDIYKVDRLVTVGYDIVTNTFRFDAVCLTNNKHHFIFLDKLELLSINAIL